MKHTYRCMKNEASFAREAWLCHTKNGGCASLHWYHRQRVSEEDRLPFGKTVGLGTVIIGAALIFFGALSLASERFDVAWLTLVGSVVMIIGIVSGLGLSFWAMIKYNKGIF